MTLKEKAKELVNKFYDHVNCWNNKGDADYKLAELNAKKCALIAVTEIINALAFDFENPSENTIYWLKVKQEIEKL